MTTAKKGRPTSRPTSFDIAQLAGVSQPTVSRALRGTGVSEEVRRRVLAAAEQLHYKVDVNARKLRSSGTNTIALLVREDMTASEYVINPFFMPIIGAVSKAASAAGYDVVLALQESSTDWTADYGFSRRSDGIIFLGYGEWCRHAQKIHPLMEAGTPFVTWGPYSPGQPGGSVGSENFAGAVELVTHLVGHGRRRIAFIGDMEPNFEEFHQRFLGYRQVLEGAQIAFDPALCVGPALSKDDGYEAVARLRRQGVGFDAVFAASDLLALGAIQALNDAGLSVPGDVAVVGFDDIWAAACASPPLTTVRQDPAEAGRMLVQSLLDIIQGRPAERRLAPTALMVRRSCGCS